MRTGSKVRISTTSPALHFFVSTILARRAGMVKFSETCAGGTEGWGPSANPATTKKRMDMTTRMTHPSGRSDWKWQ